MKNEKIFHRFLVLVLMNLQWVNGNPAAGDRPLIFPVPLEVQILEDNFIIDSGTFILIPPKPARQDNFLAGLMSNEFADKYEVQVLIRRKPAFTDRDKGILIGDITNPLIKSWCDQKGLTGELKTLGGEGYILSVTSNNIVVAANNNKGALFGLESLRQLIKVSDGKLIVPQVKVKDAPAYPFRGIKLYLPGRENITFFKRFIRDFAAYYKFNTIILELNANMRLERHPELNIGAVQFERMLNFSRLDRPPGKHMEYQNSSHQDNADGGILEKEEVADLVSYMRQFNMEVIPELPSLTHAYYLLAGHEELAENMEQPVPDTYCPLKPGSYKLYFDVLDEYIDVIHPKTIHIGHDEWRMEKDLCELCKGKDYGELYAADVTKIHDYLAKKGIKIALWGDHLLESVTEKEFQTWKSSSGYQYKIPGALRPEQVLKLIPNDILIFNWFWDEPANDKQVSDFGFKQVYGNLRADIEKWDERHNVKGLLGGAPSSWAATTEFNFGKDQLVDFLGCSNLLWSKQHAPVDKLALITDALVSDINFRFSGKKLPSQAGSEVIPVDLSPYFNSALGHGIDSLNHGDLLTGMVGSGNRLFELNAPAADNLRAVVVSTQKGYTGTKTVWSIKINQDVNSLIFLHACAREGNNQKAYSAIYNFDDTSELLGWYEVIYDDGLVITIPVRYGANILDWRWMKRILGLEKPKAKNSQNQYAYNAPSVLCSAENTDPVSFFAFEWENPRFGKTIREINIRSVSFNRNNSNSIILLALSITENTKKADSKGVERE
jgi:hypothetical protein